MAKTSKQKIITKKHLARLERERRQRRYILAVSITVVVLVVGFIGYGILDRLVLQVIQPVATVNKVNITTKDWQARVRYARQGIIQQYEQTYQMAQYFGSDASTSQYFQSSLTQIAAELDDPTTIGNQVLNTMIQDELIKTEAKQRGISIADADIDKVLQEDFGYFPNGTLTPTPELPTLVVPTLNPTQLSLITSTPTLTPTVPATATTSILTVTLTPTVIPAPTQVPTPTLTPTPYTEQAYQANLKQGLDNINKNIQIDQAAFNKIIAAQLLRQKVMEALTADISHTEDQVWTRQIVVTDTATADKIVQLLKSGQDFSKLANQYTVDTATKANGGDTGWQSSTSLDAAVAKEAFALKNPGDVSTPTVGTKGIYILQLIGHEIRQLSSTDYDSRVQQKFNDWLTAQRSAATVKIYDYWKDRVPAVPTLPAGYAQTTPTP